MPCIYPKRGSVRLRVSGCDAVLAPPERQDGHLRAMGVAALRVWRVPLLVVMVLAQVGLLQVPPP